ncbi:hypothetical protein WIW50_08570 [Flavobacteriaceae bacterium 3-367]|uniref:hypothetical protein n=1 Tax=Eudoraea algarum TaxID=3417568 RepID=UPI003291D097
MGSIKKIFLSLLLLGLAALVWYLFIKDHDYQIRFNEKTAPGTLFHQVNNWGLTMEKNGKIKILGIQKEPFSHFRQNLKVADSIIQLDWDFKAINDSVTSIRVRITDTENSLATRIKNLYTDPPLKNMFLSKIKDFKNGLDDHLRKHKVKIVGVDSIPLRFYAYAEASSSMTEKARTMISKNAEIVGWLTENNIKILDEPTLEVTHWDKQRDSIAFNFLFPVAETDSLPQHKDIRFKRYGGKKGIKAIFNGNYMISDRAWFALYEYGKRNNIALEETPVELFHHNPMTGGNELEWKAEIYLPLKESDD